MKSKLYNYKVRSLEKVLDGDTFDALIDLGFNIVVKKRIRLNGINCPEVRTRDLKIKELGIASKNFLIKSLESAEIYITSYGEGKYGRVIADVFSKKDGKLTNINELITSSGYGEKKEY